MTKRLLLLAPILAVAAALSAAPAEAKGNKGGKHKDGEWGASVRDHGPPSWAPAHGYRRKAARDRAMDRSYSRSTTTIYRSERRVWDDRW